MFIGLARKHPSQEFYYLSFVLLFLSTRQQSSQNFLICLLLTSFLEAQCPLNAGLRVVIPLDVIANRFQRVSFAKGDCS
jgi:hypothetical protein